MTDHAAATQNDRLAQEIAHWRFACDALADLDAVASPAAWASLEEYLRMRVRDRLAAAVAIDGLARLGRVEQLRWPVGCRAATRPPMSAGGCCGCVGTTCKSKPFSTSTATLSPHGPTRRLQRSCAGWT